VLQEGVLGDILDIDAFSSGEVKSILFLDPLNHSSSFTGHMQDTLGSPSKAGVSNMWPGGRMRPAS